MFRNLTWSYFYSLYDRSIITNAFPSVTFVKNSSYQAIEAIKIHVDWNTSTNNFLYANGTWSICSRINMSVLVIVQIPYDYICICILWIVTCWGYNDSILTIINCVLTIRLSSTSINTAWKVLIENAINLYHRLCFFPAFQIYYLLI